LRDKTLEKIGFLGFFSHQEIIHYLFTVDSNKERGEKLIEELNEGTDIRMLISDFS